LRTATAEWSWVLAPLSAGRHFVPAPPVDDFGNELGRRLIGKSRWVCAHCGSAVVSGHPCPDCHTREEVVRREWYERQVMKLYWEEYRGRHFPSHA
jgi:hypothetical protein